MVLSTSDLQSIQVKEYILQQTVAMLTDYLMKHIDNISLPELMIPIATSLDSFVQGCDCQRYQKIILNYYQNVIQKQIHQSSKLRQ